MIRIATPLDIDAILDIWNPIIRDSVFTFNSQQKTQANMVVLLEQKENAMEPFIVSELDGRILGFATYGQFRGGNGYRFTVEHTVIVGEGNSGLGIGRSLLQVIEKHAKNRGMHSMIAGVSADNTVAVLFHAAIGYSEIARLPEVGRKFDRWFDLVLMQKRL
ncbi:MULTISPECIES: GNAT family N-acetyltransferase [Falsihalocynthiibacter]|uniref:GNAT family N-acetyltransferase n=1 Tax=Falsihalocynthiibacter TaxID=2854182 RepID=UPI0030010BC5